MPSQPPSPQHSLTSVASGDLELRGIDSLDMLLPPTRHSCASPGFSTMSVDTGFSAQQSQLQQLQPQAPQQPLHSQCFLCSGLDPSCCFCSEEPDELKSSLSPTASGPITSTSTTSKPARKRFRMGGPPKVEPTVACNPTIPFDLDFSLLEQQPPKLQQQPKPPLLDEIFVPGVHCQAVPTGFYPAISQESLHAQVPTMIPATRFQAATALAAATREQLHVGLSAHPAHMASVAHMAHNPPVRHHYRTMTTMEKDAVFRLGVSLITHGNMKVADVAKRLCIQPQEPRSLTRYKRQLSVNRTNYKDKFHALHLNETQVPALVQHFFPEGFNPRDFGTYTGIERRGASVCPPPARRVGERWSGSNGDYECVAHRPCGCPGRNGTYAVIVKLSTRKKRSRSSSRK